MHTKEGDSIQKSIYNSSAILSGYLAQKFLCLSPVETIKTFKYIPPGTALWGASLSNSSQVSDWESYRGRKAQLWDHTLLYADKFQRRVNVRGKNYSWECEEIFRKSQDKGIKKPHQTPNNMKALLMWLAYTSVTKNRALTTETEELVLWHLLHLAQYSFLWAINNSMHVLQL